MNLYSQAIPKGDPHAVPPSPNIKFKEWPAENLDPDVKPGDYVSRFDERFVWTSRCLKGRALEPLRHESDDLADGIVNSLNLQPREDGLAKLLAHRSVKEVQEFYNQVTKVPEWVDWEQIKRGQDMFWQNSPAMLLSLLHYSLTGGFAAPKIVSVLACTGYLHSKNKAEIRRRLFETTDMVFDCMYENALRPESGRGWKSVLRVRLLHAQVRMHIIKINGAKQNALIKDTPINQEDLICTLGAFSVAMFLTLQRAGILLTEAQRRDYVALWRYIGYLLGISQKYDPLKDLETAEGWFFSIGMHLVEPDDSSKKFALGLLGSLAGEAPLRLPIDEHYEIARTLLGPKLAQGLGIPETNEFYREAVKAELLLQVTVDKAGRWSSGLENYLTRFAENSIPERVEAAKKAIVVGEGGLAVGEFPYYLYPEFTPGGEEQEKVDT